MKMSEEWYPKEVGFSVEIEKPIPEMTDEELSDLDSDCELLEDEVEKLRKLIDEEMNRRNW